MQNSLLNFDKEIYRKHVKLRKLLYFENVKLQSKSHFLQGCQNHPSLLQKDALAIMKHHHSDKKSSNRLVVLT